MDIFISSLNLIIETDGDYWHGNINKYPKLNKWQLEQREEDSIRTNELQEKGYNVLRLWECDIRKMDLNEFQKTLKYSTMEVK